jgi:phosphatidylglycerol:prolipoprotein diacylglycerol transferase
MHFPSSIAFYVASHPVRWYGIAYAVGVFLGWYWSQFLVQKKICNVSQDVLTDFLSWVMPAILISGRLGHALLYAPSDYLQNPFKLLCVWEGGMSFHGAILGCALASWYFTKTRGISWLALTDCCLCSTPIGLFLGRIGNFVNQELYGRVWSKGIVFPLVDGLPRHPNQLYEAGLEGVLLFILMNVLAFRTSLARRVGALSGVFLIAYASARWVCEYFREPDTINGSDLGVLSQFVTPGQLFSIPMVMGGVYLFYRSARQKRPSV